MNCLFFALRGRFPLTCLAEERGWWEGGGGGYVCGLLSRGGAWGLELLI